VVLKCGDPRGTYRALIAWLQSWCSQDSGQSSGVAGRLFLSRPKRSSNPLPALSTPPEDWEGFWFLRRHPWAGNAHAPEPVVEPLLPGIKRTGLLLYQHPAGWSLSRAGKGVTVRVVAPVGVIDRGGNGSDRRPDRNEALPSGASSVPCGQAKRNWSRQLLRDQQRQQAEPEACMPAPRLGYSLGPQESSTGKAIKRPPVRGRERSETEDRKSIAGEC